MKQIKIKNKVVLCTGGTGSLGQVLVNRLLKEGAKEVRVYSRDEYKQSEMIRHLNNNKVKYWLGDIRDLETLKGACDGVDIIIHVAAMKRMDQSSHNTFDVADVNIRGTRNVMLAGKECEKIIFVSSDKAANCKNVYGATKFIAENIALAYSNSIVWRFGNIIGSRGSVWEIFKEQKEQGLPFTITDLNSTRFIINIDDVCDCLLSDVKHGLYYPKNLKAMTIKQIADSVEVNHPYVIIGLRKNETLHEKFNDEYSSDKCLIK
jgi:UDP-glucose 4-epimerase